MTTLYQLLKDEHSMYIGDGLYWIEDGIVWCELRNGMILNCDFMADDEVCQFDGHWIFADLGE